VGGEQAALPGARPAEDAPAEPAVVTGTGHGPEIRAALQRRVEALSYGKVSSSQDITFHQPKLSLQNQQPCRGRNRGEAGPCLQAAAGFDESSSSKSKHRKSITKDRV
jgi:hypothetical protein